MDKLREIVKKVKDIPALPSATSKVLLMIGDPKIHILKIADLIQQDFSLATRILRMANSAYYAQGRRITTVLEAIVLLGLNTVKELLIAASTYQILNKKVEGYLLEEGDLWKHSLCCAMASEIIANECNSVVKDKAYIAGLLHDVGKLILAHNVEDELIKITEVVEKEQVSFDVAEEKVIGFSHALLGAKVLQKWHFPEEIVNAIEFHHKPDNAQNFDLASIVHIADVASLMLGLGLGVDGLYYKINEKAFDLIELNKEDFEKILGKITDAIAKIMDDK